MLTVDLETRKPDGFKPAKKGDEKPDFRIDIVERVGWLEDDNETAQWSRCFCPIPIRDDWLTHGGIYDIGCAAREFEPDIGPWLRGLDLHDTLAAAYCNGEEDLSLKGLAQKLLGVQTVTWEQQNLIGEDQYHAQDLFLTRQIFPKLMERNRGTAYEIDRKLIPALVDCSHRGYMVDQDRLEEAIAEAEDVARRLVSTFDTVVEGASVLKANRKVTRKNWPEDVTDLYGDDIVLGDGPTRQRQTWGPPDIGSAKQLQQFFGVPSVDKAVIRDLIEGGGPLSTPAYLRQHWAKVDKLLDTYYYPARGKERLTGLYNIYPGEDREGGADTGRLSSERANLQNLTDELERCLHAPEDWDLLRGDYGQVELRGAAEISNDEYLIGAFLEGRDIHEETRQWLGLDSRTKAKNFNFGAGLYGGGPHYISQVVGRPMRDVAGLMTRHRELWTGWWKYADAHWLEVQRTGKSVSPEPFLHVRTLPLMNEERAYKQAINHGPQSMAAYITKHAMVRLFAEGFQLVNQVHDSIHCYVHKDEAPLRTALFKRIMEETAREYLPRVGAPVDIEISHYWEPPKEEDKPTWLKEL